MIAEEVDELVDFDLDLDPVCGGMILGSFSEGVVTHEEDCSNEAKWIKVVRHCGVRGVLKCDKHYSESTRRPSQCRVCFETDVPYTWVRL